MSKRSEVVVAVRRTAQEALQTALSKLSFPLEITPDKQSIVIKPSIYDPSLIGNTTKDMVRAVVNFFRDAAKIYIVESDNPLRTAEDAFARSGYDSLRELGVSLLNLTSCPLKEISMPGYFFKTHPMPSLLATDSFLINIATVKAEPEICVLGAGIKNLFGLIPERNKAEYHSDIDSILLDLLQAFRPDLTIIDLTWLVVGNREDGNRRYVGGVVAGTDPVAVDAFCADLFGLDPMKIPHIKLAYDIGLGEALIDRIGVLGTDHQKRELVRLMALQNMQHE